MNELLLSSQHGSVLKLVFKTANELKHDLYTSRIYLSMLKIVLIKENLRRWEKKKNQVATGFPLNIIKIKNQNLLLNHISTFLYLPQSSLGHPSNWHHILTFDTIDPKSQKWVF